LPRQRYIGWLRVRLRPAHWIAVSNAADELDAWRELRDYISTTGICPRQISAVVLPTGQHPTRTPAAS
jgi:hypothetical protein